MEFFSSNKGGNIMIKNFDAQFPRDLFHIWKKQQEDQISERGANIDPGLEEEHNQAMLRQNLNAFVCYASLDKYTECLKANNLLDKRGDDYEINTRNRQNEVRCRPTHMEYVNCMSSNTNKEAVMRSAAMHPSCQTRRQVLFECFREHEVEETRSNNAQCSEPYRRLVRCGLNHLWNEYWRSLTNFGENEEFHLYQMSKDDKQRQQFLQFATDKATVERIAKESAAEVNAGTIPSWRKS
jgi:hypothetical protein